MRFWNALLGALLAVLTLSVADAQTTSLSPQPIQHFTDNNGNLCTGCQLFTYEAGTTTPQNTYTDSTGATPNANPIILNARGEAPVWLTPGLAYKYVLSPSNDTRPPTNPYWTVDNIMSGGMGQATASTNAALEAISTAQATSILRCGVNTAGDAPCVLFQKSGSACGISGGDIGSQVPSADSKCWLASYPASGADFREWGAVGGQDVTTALTNAISWVFGAYSRLTITAPSTPYDLSATIKIGNGTSTTQSTLGGAEIIGVPTGIGADEGDPANQPMMFKWTGASNTIPFIVEGPIWRVTLSGITLDCNSICGTGFEFIHPIWSHFDNDMVKNWTQGNAFILTAYGHSVSGLAQSAAHNSFSYLEAVDPVAGSGASGIIIGQSSATGEDFDPTFDNFYEGQFTYDGTSSSACGITLQFTDVINFFGGSSQPILGTSGNALCVVPPTGLDTFPQNVSFYNVELNGSVTYLSGWAPSHSISFYPFTLADNSAQFPAGPSFNAFSGIQSDGQPFGQSNGSILSGNGGSSTLSLASTTQHVGQGCNATSSGYTCAIALPAAGQLRNLNARISVAPGSGQTVTATLWQDGNEVAMTCTISGATAVNCSSTQVITVAAGDYIVMDFTGSGSAASAVPIWSVFYDHN